MTSAGADPMVVESNVELQQFAYVASHDATAIEDFWLQIVKLPPDGVS